MNYEGWAIQQAWFSTFRWWAEVDPRAAAAKLAEFLGPANRTGRLVEPGEGLTHEDYLLFVRQQDAWKREAFEEVFLRLAKIELGAAWEMLPQRDISEVRTRAIEGLFRGVDGVENLERLLELWEPEWNPEEAHSLVHSIAPAESSGPRLEVGSAIPTREDIAIQAALAMAQTDPAEAITWLRNSGTDSNGYRGNRERLFYNELAQDNPAAVTTLLREDSDQAAFLLTALITAHPERAQEYIGLVESRDSRIGAIMMATPDQSRLHVADLFPAPGRPNRLPNYEERYHGLLEAVQGAGLDPDAAAGIFQQLNGEFAQVVPEAAAATSPTPE